MIGQTPLGDVRTEQSFELLPSSRVTAEVRAAAQPQEREKDDNFFPGSQLEAGDLKGFDTLGFRNLRDGREGLT